QEAHRDERCHRGEQRRELHALSEQLADDDPPRRERRERDELERLLHSLIAKRIQRTERNDRETKKPETGTQRRERPAACRTAAAERISRTEECDCEPGDQGADERDDELASAHELTYLLHNQRTQPVAPLFEPDEQRFGSGHCTRPSVISMNRS